jgi:voltage-gated potassium channel Kch
MPARFGTALVVGELDAARRACARLEQHGYRVRHLLQPSEEELSEGLSDDVVAVVIIVHGDVTALRYALYIEHKRPKVRLVVTLFDRTVANQLVRAVPNCVVTSPADIAVPDIIRACRLTDTDGRSRRIGRPEWRRFVRLSLAQLRPYDATTRMLVAGLCGLLVVVGSDWLIAIFGFRESGWNSLFDAVRTVATVGSRGGVSRLPAWYLGYASVMILATIGLTAAFTASVVSYLHSARSVRLLGRLTLPVRDHVIVVGLGQVGLRLCMELKARGVPVVAVERDPNASNLRLATLSKIPVFVAHAEDRAVLRRLALTRARALATMGSDDLDNVAVAIAALAVSPAARVVLRAGESAIIAETTSLFPIGEICNVSALTAERVAEHVLEDLEPATAGAHLDAGPARCSC